MTPVQSTGVVAPDDNVRAVAERRGPVTRPNDAALFALALLTSDFHAGRVWIDHPAATAIVVSLAVAPVSVTVIEAVLNRRSERRSVWRRCRGELRWRCGGA